MKATLLAALIVLGIGLIGAPVAWGASANGTVIGEAARASSPIVKVPCRVRRVCDRYGCRSVRRCW